MSLMRLDLGIFPKHMRMIQSARKYRAQAILVDLLFDTTLPVIQQVYLLGTVVVMEAEGRVGPLIRTHRTRSLLNSNGRLTKQGTMIPDTRK